MYKKIILLMLALLISFTGVYPVYASENAVMSDDYYYTFAKGSVNTMGVAFTSDDMTSHVSRGEFVASLVALSGMSDIEGGTIPYVDIDSASPYYNAVKTAHTLSWISDSSLFNPDEPITYAQALKIGVHAIGGEYQAAFYGGYPTGYVYLGNTLEFSENIAVSNDRPLTLRDAYILLYNIISSKTFDTSYESEDNVSISFGAPSIMENYHDMFVCEGILTANSVTNLYDEFETDRETLKVGNEEFIDENGLFDYLGYNVRLLYHKDGSKKYAKLITPCDTNVVVLNNNDINNYSANTVNYADDEGRERKLTLAPNFVHVFNGKTTILTTNDLTAILNDNTSEFTFIDNNDDNRYDVFSVKKYEYTYVGRFDLYEKIIYDLNSSQSMLDLSDDNCKFSVKSYEKGQYKAAELSSIKTGSVIASAVSADKTYADIVICNDIVSGSVDEKTSDGKIVIDSATYTLSDYYNLYYKYKVGEKSNFYLGLNNEIVAESSSRSSMNYCYIIDSARGSGLNNEVLLKIFDQSNKILVLAVNEKVKKDSIAVSDNDIYNYEQSLTTEKDRFVRYSVNGDNKIVAIDSYDNKIDDVDSYGQDYYDDNKLSLHFEGNYLPRGGKIFADSSGRSKFNYLNTEYIFVLPEESERDDEELYRIADVSEIKTNSSDYRMSLLCYDADKSGSPKAMVVVSGYLQSSESIDLIGGSGVVEKVSVSVDANGDEAYKLYVCTVSGYTTLYLPIQTAAKYFVPSAGDIIGYNVKGQNIVSYLVSYFDIDNYTVGSSFTTESGAHAVTSGFAYSVYGGYIHYLPAEMQTPYMPVCPETIDYSQMRNINYSQAKTVYIDIVRSPDGATIKSVSVNANPETRLKDIKTCGRENATFVVNKLTYNSSQTTYAYNITYK